MYVGCLPIVCFPKPICNAFRPCSYLNTVMTSNPSDSWSPPEGTTTYTGTFSPSRQSYTSRSGESELCLARNVTQACLSDTQRYSSDGEDSANYTRRLAVSPSSSQRRDDVEDSYTDDNSIDEIDATLNNLEDEFEDTEQALSEWSHGSYSSAGPTFSSATGTFTYSGTYTGSPSFVSLPTFSPRSPPIHGSDPRARLSRITERTEESRPTSMFSSTNVSRPGNPTPDTLRRSAVLSGTPSHSRISTDPSSDRTLPPPGRLGELIAVFESNSPSFGHSRTASTPGYRATSPMFGTTQPTATGTTTGYGMGSTSYGYGSRSSSPTKSGSGSSGSYVGTDTRASLLSPPVRPTTTSGFRSTTSGVRTETGSYAAPSYTATPSGFSNTNTWTDSHTVTQTGSYTTPNTESKSYSGTEETYTRGTITPSSGLRKPQTSPRSPLASVRNIVALWKERTPTTGRTGERSPQGSASSVSPPENEGVRRRFEGARARMRESRGVPDPVLTPTRPLSGGTPDNASIRSGRSGAFPPGINLAEFSQYAQSNEPVSCSFYFLFIIADIFSSLFTSAFCGISMSTPHRHTAGKDVRHCCTPTCSFSLGLHLEVVAVSSHWIC